MFKLQPGESLKQPHESFIKAIRDLWFMIRRRLMSILLNRLIAPAFQATTDRCDQLPTLRTVLPMCLLLCFALCSPCEAGTLVWIESRDQALALAQTNSQKILLMAGRAECAECDYMHNVVCESADPAIKALIESEYVPWFCNIDSSDDWRPYAEGLSSFPLPLICTIHPTNSATYMDRSASIQSPKTFYARLLTRAMIGLTNARLANISFSNSIATVAVDQLTFGATNYLERGSNLLPSGGWETIADFVSFGRTNHLTVPVNSEDDAMYFRIRSVR